MDMFVARTEVNSGGDWRRTRRRSLVYGITFDLYEMVSGWVGRDKQGFVTPHRLLETVSFVFNTNIQYALL